MGPRVIQRNLTSMILGRILYRIYLALNKNIKRQYQEIKKTKTTKRQKVLGIPVMT